MATETRHKVFGLDIRIDELVQPGVLHTSTVTNVVLQKRIAAMEAANAKLNARVADLEAKTAGKEKRPA